MVIRKYFALSLVAASLALAGCSSDDDDDGGTTGADTTGGDTAGTATGATTSGTATGATTSGGDTGSTTSGGDTGGTATGGDDDDDDVEDTTTRSGNSILDIARGTSDTDDSDPDDDDDELEGGVDDLSELVAALGNYPELLNILDDETVTLTVFAPTNAALAQEDDLSDPEELEDTLRYHVAPAAAGGTAFDTQAVDAGVTFPLTLPTALEGATVDIVEVEGGGFAVVDSNGAQVALPGAGGVAASNGIVYVIDQVLEAPEGDDDDGGDTTGGDGDGDNGPAATGTPLRAVQDDPSLSDFLALLVASDFDQSLQDPANNGFVTFAPTNASIDADATTAAVYIDTNTTLTDDSIPAGTYRGTGPGAKQFDVTGSGDTLMVNGLAATFVTRGDGGALVKFGE